MNSIGVPTSGLTKISPELWGKEQRQQLLLLHINCRFCYIFFPAVGALL